MASPGRLPIRMRIGPWAEYEIGSLELPVDQPGTATVEVVGPRLADLLREVADQIDPPPSSDYPV